MCLVRIMSYLRVLYLAFDIDILWTSGVLLQ